MVTTKGNGDYETNTSKKICTIFQKITNRESGTYFQMSMQFLKTRLGLSVTTTNI